MRSALRHPLALRASVAPREVQAPVPAEKPRPEGVDAAGRRILVVDDDAPMLEVIGRLLTLNAFEVDAARTVEEAGPMALSGGYSGLVLDLILPDGNGLHLFRRIARERPALSRRIVFVSGRLDRRAVARFQRLVGNRLILKPFDLNELLRAVREATAAAR